MTNHATTREQRIKQELNIVLNEYDRRLKQIRQTFLIGRKAEQVGTWRDVQVVSPNPIVGLFIDATVNAQELLTYWIDYGDDAKRRDKR